MAFSLLSLMSGLGIIAALPPGMEFLHHALHDYEIPMIITSGVIIAIGWGLHYIAYRIDCHNTGCVHGPCGPKKKRSAKVLLIATGLFTLNVAAYFLIHV